MNEKISVLIVNFNSSEFVRVLGPNGKIIIMTPNYPIKRVYDFIASIRKFDMKRIKDDPTHVTYYNFQRLEKLLNKYFNKIELSPTGGFLFRIFKKNVFSHKIIGTCTN